MSETLPLGENLPWIRWFIGHFDLVPSLVGLIGELKAAEGLRAKWEAIKAIGDLLIDAVGDAPLGVQPMIEGDVEAMLLADTQALELKLGNGELLRKLLEDLPKIISIISALKPLLG